MTTWKLLRHLLPIRPPTSPGPYYARESYRLPFWARFTNLGTRLPAVITAGLLVLYFLAGYPMGILIRAMVFYVTLRLLLLLPSLLYVIVPVASVLAPVIARERENGTWEILRASPPNTDRIVMDKAAGALAGLRDWFYFMAGMMVPAIVMVGIIGLGMSMTVEYFRVDTNLKTVLWVGFMAIVALASAIGFLIDRAQQCAWMLAAALGASSSRRSMKNAIPVAVMAVAGVWLLDVMIGATILLVVAGPLEWPLELLALIVLLFSPLVAFWLELPLPWVLFLMITMLVLREGAVWITWRWTVNKARTL